MYSGKQIFLMKATVAISLIIVTLTLIGISVDATTSRFGKLGWIHLIVGILTSFGGVIVTWATVITWYDRRALKVNQVNPTDTLRDGQTVVLSGVIRTPGDPLRAPFTGQRCAAFTYQVSGQRRSRTTSSSSYVQQLCMLGYQMLPATLECGSRRFSLYAVPDVDTPFQSTTQGGDWGDIALEKINASSEKMHQTPEEDARGALADAQRSTRVPVTADYYVAPTQTGANQISIIIDVLPVDEQVTLLATFSSQLQGLEGKRLGGLKVFKGNLASCLKTIDNEFSKGWKVSLGLLTIGLLLVTLAWWAPSF